MKPQDFIIGQKFMYRNSYNTIQVIAASGRSLRTTDGRVFEITDKNIKNFQAIAPFLGRSDDDPLSIHNKLVKIGACVRGPRGGFYSIAKVTKSGVLIKGASYTYPPKYYEVDYLETKGYYITEPQIDLHGIYEGYFTEE